MNEYFKNSFIGKKIKEIHIDGYGIELLLEDNTKLEYEATDGGYSTYNIVEGDDKN